MTALLIHQRLDSLAVDHLLECPTCGDLWPLYRVRCDCGVRILPSSVKAHERHPLAVAR